MAQLSAWMGAGMVAAGVSAALIAGADAAAADTGSSDTAGASASTSETADRGPRASDDTASESDSTDSSSTTKDADAATGTDDASDADDADVQEASDPSEEDVDPDADADISDTDTDTGTGKGTDSASVRDHGAVTDTSSDDEQAVEDDAPESTGRDDPAESASAGTKPARPESSTDEQSAPPSIPVRPVSDTVAAKRVSASFTAPTALAAPAPRTLQHGYRGVGPMYSYTASWLAERTNSTVVVPTLSSNPYVRDGFWLGDDQVYRATAALLLGDRDALTASAVAAGFAKRYGADAALPDRFTLVGHSLGAGVVAGTAGYYAEAVIAGGAVNQLAGVITLDGAPPGSVLADALDKLDGLGTYIPVIELGAPREDGSPRRVDEALNAHRPGHFNGVILDNGQHLDSMQGGSKAIQLISYLNQGFPTEQNKSAAQTLMAGWINDIFAGRIDASTGACAGSECAGIYGEPGQAVSVATPVGPATGVVIGTAAAPVTTEFRPMSAVSLLSSRSTSLRLAIAG